MFNEQSSRLLARYPDLRDEVAWRVSHLNSKWETLELAMTPSKGASSQRDMCTGEHCYCGVRLALLASGGLPLPSLAGAACSLIEGEGREVDGMPAQRAPCQR